jgi:flagellar hook-length control protein FliK
MAPGLDAAIKELLQRKQALAGPVAAAPAPAASPETAKAEAAPAAPAAPVAIQAAAPPAAAELPQPVLTALDSRPAAPRAGGATEAARSPDLPAERQLDLARDTEWLDRLARDIARAGATDGPLRFRLHPQSLGHLHVELQQGDHGTAVRLTVETEAARQLLADAQPRLAAEARAQGVRIAETHVDLASSGRDAPGDRRRQDETRQTPLIRTARGAGTEAVASARSSGRARLDRYA